MEQYLSAGKAVLVEKPFVVSRAEAERVVELSRSKQAPVLVGHFRRFYPGLRTARAYLTAGGLGRIRRVEATEGARWNWPSQSPYVVESPFGGVISDTGSHLLDMTLYLLDADTGDDAAFAIRNVSKAPAAEPSHECRAVIELRTPHLGSVEVYFAVSRLEPLAGAVKVYGDAGVLIVPTAFSAAPLLLHGTRPFALDGRSGSREPRDGLGCFVLEHLEFLALGPGARPPSSLSAERFVRLTAILESLGNSPLHPS